MNVFKKFKQATGNISNKNLSVDCKRALDLIYDKFKPVYVFDNGNSIAVKDFIRGTIRIYFDDARVGHSNEHEIFLPRGEQALIMRAVQQHDAPEKPVVKKEPYRSYFSKQYVSFLYGDGFYNQQDALKFFQYALADERVFINTNTDGNLIGVGALYWNKTGRIINEDARIIAEFSTLDTNKINRLLQNRLQSQR
ncbi:MAG TPA: hypothetical protein DEA31_02165 [Alphaproteobacteria bacterium]|nr:hypothetical protein [Alphaproteobacteria bacterium]